MPGPPRIANCAVVLYAEGVLVYPEDEHGIQSRTFLETLSPPSLDLLASKGCSGQLQHRQDAASSQEVLQTLLGVHKTSTNDIPSYTKMMNVTLFTTSEKVAKLPNLQDDISEIQKLEHIDPKEIHEYSAKVFQQIIDAAQEKKILNHPCFIFCHFDKECGTPKNIILVLNEIVHKLISLNEVFMSLIVSPSNGCFKVCDSPETINIPSSFPAPIQSHCILNGKKGHPSARFPLLFTNYMVNRTRKDSVTKFNEKNILQHGAYSKMLIDAYMQEMAFRLGVAPKYGS